MTRNPPAEWLARQLSEAFPWETAPKYLVQDDNRAFGAAFTPIRAMDSRQADLFDRLGKTAMLDG